jgi:hypothetical protein
MPKQRFLTQDENSACIDDPSPLFMEEQSTLCKAVMDGEVVLPNPKGMRLRVRKPMTRGSTARTYASFGKTIHEIADLCDLEPDYVKEYYSNIKPANSNAVLREVPFNGGCTSLSGVAPVAMPRISIIDGERTITEANDNASPRRIAA